MPPLAERWCDLSPLCRLGIWIGMLLFTCALWRFSVPAVEKSAPPTELQAQWRKLLPLRVEQKEAQSQTTQPFSATAFQTEGSAVMSWQPGTTGGELVLQLQWQALLRIFPLLAEQNMRITGFSLLPEQQGLQVKLQLETLPDE